MFHLANESPPLTVIFFPSRTVASILYLTTVSSSNASVNLTLSAGGENISTVFNSSLGLVSIVDLPPNETTHLTVTYIPGTGPTLFSLESIIITVPNNS